MGFIDSFFGSSGGNDDLRYGYDQSKNIRQSGLKRYTGTVNDALMDAGNYYTPYIEQGQQAGDTYYNALGLNGVDAQQGYFDTFQNDPGFQASLDQAQSDYQNSAAARGGLFSGRTAQGLFNQAQQARYGAYQDRMNRLAQLGGQGQQAANTYGGLTYQTGNNIADAQFGTAQQNAAGFMGLQNQIANSRGSGFQGLLNLGANVGKAFI